jgi:hypothetical protein
MALDNYADLQTAILSWLARPGDTLISSSVPDLITLFESHARRELFTDPEEKTTTLSIIQGNALVALPTYFAEARELTIADAQGNVHDIEYVSPETMDDMFPLDQVDQPRTYTIEGANIRFGPIPDSAYTASLDYIQGLQALSNTNTTNWLLASHPDAYLFGSLAEAEALIGNDERVPMWIQRRDAVIADIQLADRKMRWSGPLQMKIKVPMWGW